MVKQVLRSKDGTPLRIAIFHNFLDNIGGAEIVGLTLARELSAEVYTTNIDFEKIAKMGFKDIPIHSIGKIPLNAPFRQQMALSLFRRLNLRDKYDFYIIDGDWAMSGAVNHHPNLWYVHSPIREIWDLYGYTRQHTVPFLARPLFDIWVLLNRHLNRSYVRSVDYLACNSNTTRERVKRFLARDAKVIHPPIATSLYHYRKNGGFWLSVNRLISHKRVDMQMRVFQGLPDERLVVVGSYEQSRHFKSYASYIQRIKPENVTIHSWVDEKTLRDLYATCKGFITTSQNEDFGMTVVEAMAAGKPVIAPREGGYRESVIPGKTGILIDGINDKKLLAAIKQISKNPARYRKDCELQAKKFDTDRFIQQIKEIILQHEKA